MLRPIHHVTLWLVLAAFTCLACYASIIHYAPAHAVCSEVTR